MITLAMLAKACYSLSIKTHRKYKMFMESKVSKMHVGKTFEMREGLQGNGKPVFEIYTMINGNCKHIEHFRNKYEALHWWSNACN